MAKEVDRPSLGDFVYLASVSLAVITSWLYTTGWEYAYHYFQELRIPLLILDISFQQMLVYGALVALNWRYLVILFLLFFAFLLLPIKKIYFRHSKSIRAIAFAVGVIVFFWFGHSAGGRTALQKVDEARRHDYDQFPRIYVDIKKGSLDLQSQAWGDVVDKGCGRLITATKDWLFLLRPARSVHTAGDNYITPVAGDSYVIPMNLVAALRITGNYNDCP